jgi:hypothetical protein
LTKNRRSGLLLSQPITGGEQEADLLIIREKTAGSGILRPGYDARGCLIKG